MSNEDTRPWDALTDYERRQAVMRIRQNPAYDYLFTKRALAASQGMLDGATIEIRENARQRLLALRDLQKEVETIVTGETS